MNNSVAVDTLPVVGVDFGRRRIRAALYSHGDPRSDLFDGRDYIVSHVCIREGNIHFTYGVEKRTTHRNAYCFYDIRDRFGTDGFEVNATGSRELIPAKYVASAIFEEIKNSIVKFKSGIRDIVLTVPLYSSLAYRTDLIYAAEIQGFNVRSVISEPAAVACEFNHFTGEKRHLKKFVEATCIITYCLSEDGYECSLIKMKDKDYTILGSCRNHCIDGFPFRGS